MYRYEIAQAYYDTRHQSVHASGSAVLSDRLLGVIYQRNRVWISEVVVSTGERVLRTCITSFATTPDDIACLVTELAHARARLG